jgi:hypothetical protein
MKHTTLFLLILLCVSSIEAQYMPADSSFFRSGLYPISELEQRIRQLEQGTQAFEQQSRIGKYMLITGTTTVLIGVSTLNQAPMNPVGWLLMFTGATLGGAGNILILDAPRALRVKKDRKKRLVG